MYRVPLRSSRRAWSGLWLAGFAHQIFSRAGKEFSQQAGNAFEKHPLVRAERVFAVALYVQKPDLPPRNPPLRIPCSKPRQ